MADRDNRRAIQTRAFRGYSGLRDRINLDGETRVFLSDLIGTLREYGDVEARRPSVYSWDRSGRGWSW